MPAQRPWRMERAFWVVTLIIALTDSLFVYLNYQANQQAFRENLLAEGVRQESVFELTLSKQGLHMQQFASYLAHQPEIRDLFIAGRLAVDREGGGSGGEEASRIREALFDEVSVGWQHVAGVFDSRQLHFHIGPGARSFLRVHSPENHGDDLSSIRHSIVHAIANNIATQGFEAGRVYAGIRGVVPVAVPDPAAGAPWVVGAVEAGSSFLQVLRLLEEGMNSSYAVLMSRQHFEYTHFPSLVSELIAQRPYLGDWFIEASSDEPLLRSLWEDRLVQQRLGSRLPSISFVDGRSYAIYSFPFRDFLRNLETDRPAIGHVLVWHDASDAVAMVRRNGFIGLLLGLTGFALVEVLLFTAWNLVRNRLQAVIDTKVVELSDTNDALHKEVSLRMQSERKLKNYQIHLEALVEQRTRSLRDSVGALELEVDRRRSVEQALQQERDQARVTLRSIVDGVITTGPDSRVRFLNPAAEQLTGWSLADALDQPLAEVFLARDMERAGRPFSCMECLSGECERQHGENTELTRRDGRRLTVEHSLSPIRNETGESLGLVLVFHDVTEARELSVRLSFQASHDALTGLVNRRAIELELGEALRASRSYSSAHVFLYIDLDQFKLVNDTCGHVAGDELLRQLSKLLLQQTRQSDCLARLGGDEFGLLLRNCELRKSRLIAESLLESLQVFRFVWNERSFRVGASIGVAAIDADSESVQAVMSAADAACYLAKEKGRGRVHLSLPDDGELEMRRGEMQWVSRIQSALAEDRFVLFGQPILPIDADPAAPIHQEILVRMLDESGDLIAPSAFIPAAERYGVMPEVDRWIIDRTCRLIQSAQVATGQRSIRTYNVNLSGATMADETILAFIRDRMACYAIDPGLLCFEVTETAAIANLAKAIDLMTALKQDGSSFALDDFGSGLSSFGYLKALPVDYIKIDGSFVRNMDTEQIDRVMVRAINEVGHAMSLKTIAEFVENDAIMAELRVLGVDYVQGFGVGVPRPLQA